MPPRSRRRPIRFGIVIALVFGLLLSGPPPAPVDGGLRLPAIDWSAPLDVLGAPVRLLATGAQAAGRWLLGGFGAAPVAAAEPSDPADDGPSTRQEVISLRGRDVAVYREPSGAYTAVFGSGLHYRDDEGDWQKVDLDFRADGGSWVADRNEIVVRITPPQVQITERGTGKGVSWKTPNTPAVSGRKATFAGQGGLTWEYANTPAGIKLQATVDEALGPKTYSFDYQMLGNAHPFQVDAGGNLVSEGFFVPRAFALGADDEIYPASAWRTENGAAVFDLDDTALPPAAFPYVLDPTTTFGQDSNGDDGHVSRTSGDYPPTGTISVDTSSTRVNVYRAKSTGAYTVRNGFGKWPTASIPNTAVILGATLRLDITFHLSDDAKSLLAEWYPASNWPIDSADYSAGALWSASGSAGWDIASLSNGQTNLPLVGFTSGVSKTGDTGVRFHIESGLPAAENKVHFKAREDPDAGSAAKLIVTYDTPPNLPTSLKVAGEEQDATIPDSTPELSGFYSDPDPDDAGYLEFEVWDGDVLAWTNAGDPDNVPESPGQELGVLVPPGVLEDGGSYSWRARAWDGDLASGWVDGPSFTIDTSSLKGTLTSPDNGDTVSGTITLTAQPDPGSQAAAVRFFASAAGRERLIGFDEDPAGGYSVPFDTTGLPDGRINIRAEFAVDNDLSYCCSPGAGAALIVNNAVPGPEEWEASADADALAPTEGTDAGVALSSGSVVTATQDVEAPGRGFDAVFQRIYRSNSSAGGILGPGWRSNVEDALALQPNGDVVQIDGGGRERRYAATVAVGLKASYWNDRTPGGPPAVTREEPDVNETWGAGSPDPQIDVDNFSSRWEGYVDAPEAGTWTFYGLSDDGMKVFIDGNWVINNWVDQDPTEVSGTIYLSAGRHEIRVEHFAALGDAQAVLSWAGPNTPKEVVPASRLSHVTGYTAPTGTFDSLERTSSGAFVLRSPDQMQTHYLGDGRFEKVNRPGFTGDSPA